MQILSKVTLINIVYLGTHPIEISCITKNDKARKTNVIFQQLIEESWALIMKS